MDINDTLRRMRNSASGWTESNGEDLDYGDDMVSYFTAIDEWLSNGGFPPTSWSVQVDPQTQADDWGYSPADMQRLETER